MAEQYTGYKERGPYPGEEPDISRRQSGWLYISMGAALLLTLISVVTVVTWPLAIAAWAVVAIFFTVELIGKRAAAKLSSSRSRDATAPPPPKP